MEKPKTIIIYLYIKRLACGKSNVKEKFERQKQAYVLIHIMPAK